MELTVHLICSPRKLPFLVYLFIYLFNRFHHDYNARIRQEKNIFEQVTKTKDEGAGHTTERGSKLSVPLRKILKC